MRIPLVIVNATEKIIKDNVVVSAAALAFYTVLSMAPLIILMVTLLATIGLNLQAELLTQVQNLMGPAAASVLKSILASANDRPDLRSTSGWVATAFLIFSVSVIFAQLQSTLNVIFSSPQTVAESRKMSAEIKAFIMRRVLSFGMVVSFIFVSIVSLAASAALSYFLKTHDSVFLSWISVAANLLVFTLLFAAIFKILPDRKIDAKNSLYCGAFTAVFFIIGKGLIGVYLGRTAVGSSYGAAGALIVLLVWFYYSSLIVFLGAEISSIFITKKEHPA